MGNNCTICDEPDHKPKLKVDYPEEKPVNVEEMDSKAHNR